jgi:hypothetical protein
MSLMYNCRFNPVLDRLNRIGIRAVRRPYSVKTKEYVNDIPK